MAAINERNALVLTPAFISLDDSNAKRNTAIRKNPCNYIKMKAEQQRNTAYMTA
jgi:hypothetical protein